MAKIRVLLALERISDMVQALDLVTNHAMRTLDHSNLKAIKGLELHKQLHAAPHLSLAALSL